MPIDRSASSLTTSFAGGGRARVEYAASPDSCRVLVVDDDSLVRSRLSTLLSVARYQVEVAATGREALRALGAAPCDIVLTDWHMPDMDGLALCRHVRQMPQEKYIYVMMLSVRAGDGDILTGLTAGADAYMVKGASIDQILARLEIGRRISRRLRPMREVVLESRALSYIDPVTDAYNVRYLVRHLPREFARSQRSGHALAVLTCSIDALSVGSVPCSDQATDEVLRNFVRHANGCIRDADWLARTGQNEFMIVLPETAAKSAEVVAKRVRRLSGVDPLCQPSGPVSFAANIDVAAMLGQSCEDSTPTLKALLRAATCGAPTEDDIDTEDAPDVGAAVINTFDGPGGGKHELN
jgi:two-component system cell cycle response regulator